MSSIINGCRVSSVYWSAHGRSTVERPLNHNTTLSAIARGYVVLCSAPTLHGRTLAYVIRSGESSGRHEFFTITEVSLQNEECSYHMKLRIM